jgi:hypothetical protein
LIHHAADGPGAKCHNGLLRLNARSHLFEGQSTMTDRQFRVLLVHLRVIIGIVGFMAGVLVALAWEYL